MGKVIKKGLGRGLEAIIPKTGLTTGKTVLNIPLEEIQANRYQPRHEFAFKALEDLAASIKIYGVTQPVLVRRKDMGYELIAGERRLRASKMAGMQTIPVMVKEYSDKEALEIAIIENVQREDLSILEEAEAYKRLRDEFGLTQEEIASRVSKSRSVVANTMRLLELPEVVKESIRKKEISASHARTLLSLENNDERLILYNSIINEKLNVRQVEQKVAEIGQPRKHAETKAKAKPSSQIHGMDIFLKNLQEDISQVLKTKVSIVGNNTSGKIEINYFSFDDLERISDFIRSHPKAY